MKIFTWKQRFVVLFTTALSVALFCGIGYLIGRASGNWRLGVVLGALFSYPVTQFALLKSIQALYAKESKDSEPTL